MIFIPQARAREIFLKNVLLISPRLGAWRVATPPFCELVRTNFSWGGQYFSPGCSFLFKTFLGVYFCIRAALGMPQRWILIGRLSQEKRCIFSFRCFVFQASACFLRNDTAGGRCGGLPPSGSSHPAGSEPKKKIG